MVDEVNGSTFLEHVFEYRHEVSSGRPAAAVVVAVPTGIGMYVGVSGHL